MTKNINELTRLLGDNYIPMEEPIDLMDIFCASLCSSTKNFSATNMNVIAKVISNDDSLETNIKKLRKALSNLQWKVKKEDLDRLASLKNTKYTSKDVIYVNTDAKIGNKKKIVWLEIGNATAGLIHMLYCSSDCLDKKNENGNIKLSGHLPQWQESILGLSSFNDLFLVLDALFNLGGALSAAKDAVIFTVESTLQIGDHITVKPGKYKIVVGSNGFIVSGNPENHRNKRG